MQVHSPHPAPLVTDNPFVAAGHLWAQCTSPAFAAMDPACTVAVLPLGATEQHGPHLPLCVDTLLVDGVISLARTELTGADPVLFLPTQSVGLSTEHSAFAGTLSAAPATLVDLWCDIGAGVARSGVKKLVLFNAHGGHAGLMDVVARELRARSGLLVFHTSWYQLPLGEAVMGQFSAHEHRFGVHAGDLETSMVMWLAPTQVRTQHLQNFSSQAQWKSDNFTLLGDGRTAKQGWHMQDYNPLGAAGNALAATPAKGESLVKAAANQLVLLLREVVAHPCLPED